MSESLSRILFPLDISTFLEHYRAREYFHVRRDTPSYYDDLLNVSDLDEFLQSENLPAAFFNVVKEGARYPLEDWSRIAASARGHSRVAVPERLFDLYSEGATLILNGADSVISSLNTLCRKLAVELGFPAAVNLYITPRGAAGFSRHEDNHEVLVMQITGIKHWLLHVKEAPVVEIDLRPGDILYLPRGLAHSARTQDGDSIHLTLGLAPVYAFDLIRELATLAGENPGFQQPVPPRFAGDDMKRAFETAFCRQLQDLVLNTRPSELLERRFRTFVENQAQGWPGRLSDLRAIPEMTAETVVCRRPGILADVKQEGKFLSVRFAGKRVVVPGFLEDAITRIMSGNTFTIGEIEGLIANPGRVKLVAEFVRAGLLRIMKL